MGGWGGAVLAGDRDGFIEGAEEAFDGKPFVVAFGEGVKVETEFLAHGFEGATKLAIGVDHDQATEADFKENGLHKRVRRGRLSQVRRCLRRG